MTPERWVQIEELFHRAAECKPEERTRLLDESCSGDAELRREVELLLSGRESAGHDLQAAVRLEVNAIGFPLAGKTISHYRILEGLGGGGMGVVYKAEDIKLRRRQVAIKFLPEDLATDPMAIERFEREAHAASVLEHPNICPIYEFGEHERQPFIVMPLLEGQTLRGLLASAAQTRASLTLDTLLDLATQIAHGLEAAHQKGIIHRDIKPENVFITTRGEVKILDFGLAKLAKAGELHSTGTGAALGTAPYMSPEQARGERLDARSDLFSFGAVLYEMAAGRRAFSGNTVALTFNAILNQEPPPLLDFNPEFPPKLEEIIKRCLEKDRGLRYQSAADLRSELKRLKRDTDSGRAAAAARLTSSAGAALGTPPPERQVGRAARLRRWPLAGALVALAVAIGTYVYLRPVPPPKVLRTVRLTSSGRVESWIRLASDGPQLYCVQRTGGRYGLARVSTEGGEPAELPTPFPSNILYDISPDNSELLVGSQAGGEDEHSVWLLPAPGGSPRRLGDVLAHDAAWSPDGQRVVYAFGSDLHLVNPDGSGARKLIGTAGSPILPRWSPDGRVLRFTLQDLATGYLTLWEVSGDGRNPHRLLPGWRESPTDWGDGESGGDWTPDGKYFIFRSARARQASIWAMREKEGFVGGRSSAPALLTTTDSYVYCVSCARNGKRVFFVGDRSDRELERYDARSKQFVPYLEGAPRWVGFSRDGHWVAYTIGTGVLWRSRVDGSDRLQLTVPPMVVNPPPRWSPDGKQIAFTGQAGRVYFVPADGGNPEPVTPGPALDLDWSPDGNSLLFVRPPTPESETWNLYRLDLKTHEVVQLPGGKELRGPAYSPDGKYVVAVSTQGRGLMLFDVQSERWTELARGKWLWIPPYWSRDSKYVYAQDLSGEAQPLFRVRIGDRRMEVVTTRKQFPRADVKAYSLAGLTPDGDPLVSLIRGKDDIYALDVDFP